VLLCDWKVEPMLKNNQAELTALDKIAVQCTVVHSSVANKLKVSGQKFNFPLKVYAENLSRIKKLGMSFKNYIGWLHRLST
jgi:hypothetical protein